MKALKIYLALFFIVNSVLAQNDFSFVFITDIHIQSDSLIEKDIEGIIDNINKLNPDFVISGGDMIFNDKNLSEEKAETLFTLLDQKLAKLKMPVYYTLGNHELIGGICEKGNDCLYPVWGKKMYQERYGDTYYSYMHSGWKFIVLDGLQVIEERRRYVSIFDSLQIEWLNKELLSTDKSTPIIISTHIPLINPLAIRNSKHQVISTSSEALLDLFNGFNLKMVLQGHMHTYMNLYINDVFYISGGATGYRADQNNRGFILINITNDKPEIQFINTVYN